MKSIKNGKQKKEEKNNKGIVITSMDIAASCKNEHISIEEVKEVDSLFKRIKKEEKEKEEEML